MVGINRKAGVMLCMEWKAVPDHDVAIRALVDITENDGQTMSRFSHTETLDETELPTVRTGYKPVKFPLCKQEEEVD